jgi:DNA-binding winged helix-turn-helix (wHTH) protein/Tol biopolymer transport system component
MSTESGWQLGAVVFLPQQRLLCRAEQQVYLEPKVFLLLQALLAAEHQLLDHQQMLQQVWQGRVVSDSAIHRASSLLRKAFAELDPSQPYLETLAKVGYRLVVPVQALAAVASASLQVTVAAELPVPQQPSPRLRAWLVAALVAAAALTGWLLTTEQIDRPAETALVMPALQSMTAEDGLEYQLSVSADGKQFLYLQHSQRLSGWWLQQDTGQRQSLQFSQPQVPQAVLSPDGQQIVYQGCQSDAVKPSCQLWLRPVIADGNAAEALLAYPFDSQLQLQWQPDGQAVFFRMRQDKSQPYQIYRYQLATRQLQQLTLPETGQSDIALALSADGRQLAVLRYQQQQQRQILWYQLPQLTLDRQQALPVAATSLVFDSKQALWFDCPDGVSLLLCRWSPHSASYSPVLAVPGTVLGLVAAGAELWLSSAQQRSQIWRQSLPVSATAKAELQISSARLELMPRVWQQDLVFLSTRHGRHQIWRRQGDAAPSLLAELPAPAGFVRLSRSDDGNYLAFSQQGALYLLQLNTASCWQMLGPEYQVGVVNWQQQQLIFSSERSGDWQLWRYSLPQPLQPPATAGTAQCPAVTSALMAPPFREQAEQLAALTQLTRQGGYSGYLYQDHLLYSKYHQDGLFLLDLTEPAAEEQLLMAKFDRINWLNWQLSDAEISYFQPGQGIMQASLNRSPEKAAIELSTSRLLLPVSSGFIHQYQYTPTALWWVAASEHQGDIYRWSWSDATTDAASMQIQPTGVE